MVPLASISVRQNLLSLAVNRPDKLIIQGTTYSCVAVYEGTNVEISKSFCLFWLINYLIKRKVANEQGSFTTPSFVSFTAEERLIGEAAKNQAAMNPANTVFDVKLVLLEALL